VFDEIVHNRRKSYKTDEMPEPLENCSGISYVFGRLYVYNFTGVLECLATINKYNAEESSKRV